MLSILLVPFDRYPLVGPLSAYEITILLILPAYITALYKKNIKTVGLKKWELFALWLVAVASLLSVYQSSSVFESFKFFFTICSSVIIYSYVHSACRNIKNVKVILATFVISAAVMSLANILKGVFLLNIPTGEFIEERSIAGYVIPFKRTTVGPDVLGSFGSWVMFPMVFVVIPVWRYFISESNTYRWVVFLTIISGVLVTQHRSNILTLVFILSSCVYYFIVRSRYSTVIYIILAPTLFVSAYVLSEEILRLWNLFLNVRYSSVASRIEQYREAAKMFLENPVFGIGYASFAKTADIRVVGTYLHNLTLSSMLSLGLVGFVPLVILVLIKIKKSLKYAYRMKRNTDLLVFGALVSFAAVLINMQFYGDLTNYIFWLSLGFLSSCVRIAEKHAKQRNIKITNI
jgi:O-antigen ligase